MWFEQLVGFEEQTPEQVRENLIVRDALLISRVNEAQFIHGQLVTPSLGNLREQVAADSTSNGKLTLREVVADVQERHTDPANAGAFFQVASQFNLLEMMHPTVTPEYGIDDYERDRTQGPACAIACGAGTIYRNYFVNVNGQVGQSSDRQIDCLADFGKLIGNDDHRLWAMTNGYALPSEQGLKEINQHLSSQDEGGRDELRQAIRIGLQCGTQVTLAGNTHTVTQAYCSALPVSYTSHTDESWARFACLVLEAAYEATLCAAVLNFGQTGCRTVFLTLLGGGAFGNRDEWILAAIKRAIKLFADSGLDVAIVSYRASKPSVQNLINEVACE